ncbi:helix-turn-helix domain-containing protein [Croceimicrobium sp.]|uniref:helix-turn-helix domain-containing protein n=1 Tax=Croceimicrobium sp. TaxID=2828340 RepID=UPI003BAA1344
MSTILKNIRQLRTNKGYSQEYMAFKLGISQSTYARIENCDLKLSLNRLFQIAEVLEIRVCKLLPCQDCRPPSTGVSELSGKNT